MRNDRVLRIYTDGGCSGNQKEENLGGWGAVLEFGPGGGAATKELYGSLPNTTNNRMEMTALLEAFRAIKKDGQTIQVFSDSSYLMDCFRKKWYVNWQKNGWKTAQKKPVENRDLWQDSVLVVTDTSQGVVPIDRTVREFREMNGRLLLWLAGEADRVIRVFCGIGKDMK